MKDDFEKSEKAIMGKLEKSVEWLRHFVDTNVFDYCVVWKLGDDPSRFIEWMNCCCGGRLNVKAEPELEKNHISFLCRDVDFRHMRKSKACEALARFPDSIPLYSGIQGDVVISNQPRWICSANTNESTGTQVLIPVQGGLIEFYSEKNIPMDQEIIDFILVQLNFNSDPESMTIQSSTNFDDPVLNISRYPPHASPCSSFAKIEFLPRHGLKGSSTVTTPSNELSSLASVIDPMSPPPLLSAKQFVGKDYGSNNNSAKQKAVFSSVCEKRVAKKENGKLINKLDGQKCRSKYNEMERARRFRIRDGLYTLRALVPNISKMDKTSILGDAIEYIEELQQKVNDLKGELKELDDDNCNTRNADLQGSTRNTHTDHKQVSYGDVAEKKEQIKMEMEVNQVGTRDVLLKLIYAHKQGGFMMLMKAIDSLGLQVVDANVTTFDGMDLNILMIQANKEIQIKQLRECLIKLTD